MVFGELYLHDPDGNRAVGQGYQAGLRGSPSSTGGSGGGSRVAARGRMSA